jgi:hypothetical protein
MSLGESLKKDNIYPLQNLSLGNDSEKVAKQEA